MKKLVTVVALLLLLGANAPAQDRVAEFQAFWDQFRSAVLQNDKARIAALTSFPFTTRGPFDKDPTIKHTRTWFLKNLAGLLAQKHYRYDGPKLQPFTMRELIAEKQTIAAKDLNAGNRVWIEDFIFDKRRGRWFFTFAYTDK